jgi:hypothetical protein
VFRHAGEAKSRFLFVAIPSGRLTSRRRGKESLLIRRDATPQIFNKKEKGQILIEKIEGL